MKIEDTDLLLVVDVQNSFITGNLAVPDAKNIIPIINKYMKKFEYVIFSRDVHPINHCSFVAQGGPWPTHCVTGTNGVELHSDLNMPEDLFIVDKGALVDEEAFSVFKATRLVRSTPSYGGIVIDKLDLSHYLRLLEIKRLFVCGLATDYCVKATVLDATKNKKFDGPVFLLVDATKAAEITPGDEDKAIYEMIKAGAISITF